MLDTFPCNRHLFVLILMYNTSMVSFDGGGSADKVDDVTALPCRTQNGGYALLQQRYDNNKMAATRWRLYVTMETLWQQQDGGYVLL